MEQWSNFLEKLKDIVGLSDFLKLVWYWNISFALLEFFILLKFLLLLVILPSVRSYLSFSHLSCYFLTYISLLDLLNNFNFTLPKVWKINFWQIKVFDQLFLAASYYFNIVCYDIPGNWSKTFEDSHFNILYLYRYIYIYISVYIYINMYICIHKFFLKAQIFLFISEALSMIKLLKRGEIFMLLNKLCVFSLSIYFKSHI